jgi:hypothetical protein
VQHQVQFAETSCSHALVYKKKKPKRGKKEERKRKKRGKKRGRKEGNFAEE